MLREFSGKTQTSLAERLGRHAEVWAGTLHQESAD
jgi:hypothetical protein